MFEDRASEFFAKCDADDQPYTVTGLALSVGLCSRSELYEYELKPEFAATVRTARLRVENYNERMLQRGNCTGAIFALKQYGWRDQPQEITITAKFSLPSASSDEFALALSRAKRVDCIDIQAEPEQTQQGDQQQQGALADG